MSGVVHLVGAGPGDPDLITVRGRRLLEGADVVVYDRLGTEGLMGLCREDAVLVDAGKAPGRVALTQDEINDTLVRHARAGQRVVRLKGGDPFVFGRGGEEAQACTDAGIPVTVVPGITSAIAAPGAAMIPVTHRGVATSFTVVTGHEDPTKPGEQTDWATLAATRGTLIIMMGMGRLAAISAALVAGGRPTDQPAAAVQWGTTPRQRTVTATLGSLAEACEDAGVGSPAVLVVGDVAGLDLTPAGGGPLAGRSVVVTRARAQASDLALTLRTLGARVVELPVIRIAPVASSPDIDRAVGALGDYDMLVLTSVNGVECLAARMAERGRDARAVAQQATVVAIGPATGEALRTMGLRPDVVPPRFVAEAVLEAIEDRDLDGARVLVARARQARPELVDGLRARGAIVDEVVLYDTIVEPADATALEAALAADYVTFTSSSTVRNFVGMLDARARAAVGALRVVSIGPITSATVRAEGLQVQAEAAEFTVPGLVQALLDDAVADGKRDEGAQNDP